VTGISQQGERVRDDAIECFAKDVGQIEGDAGGKRGAEVGRCVVVPARTVVVVVGFRNVGLR